MLQLLQRPTSSPPAAPTSVAGLLLKIVQRLTQDASLSQARYDDTAARLAAIEEQQMKLIGLLQEWLARGHVAPAPMVGPVAPVPPVPPPGTGLTERQQEALDWLRANPAATARDMQAALGVGARMYYRVKELAALAAGEGEA